MSVAPKKKVPGPREEDLEEDAKSRGSPAKPAEMSEEVVEFIQAIDEYKRLQQRPFPSWSEVLDILKMLGYTKQD